VHSESVLVSSTLERPVEKSVFVQASELPADKRQAAELLLGTKLGDDEILQVRAARGRILKRGLEGPALTEAYQRLEAWADNMAQRVQGIPGDELDAAIDEAVEFVRHNRR
jgi:hypothetical protein